MRDYLKDIVYIGRYIDIRLIFLASVPKNGFGWTVVSRFIAVGQQCSDYFECFHWNSLISLKRHCRIQSFRCSGSNNTPAWLFYTDYRPCGVSGEPDRVDNKRGEFINITPLRHIKCFTGAQKYLSLALLPWFPRENFTFLQSACCHLHVLTLSVQRTIQQYPHLVDRIFKSVVRSKKTLPWLRCSDKQVRVFEFRMWRRRPPSFSGRTGCRSADVTRRRRPPVHSVTSESLIVTHAAL